MNLNITNVNHMYLHKNTEMAVLRNINLAIHNNEFVSILGLSGVGKSTLLNMIAGFIKPTDGQISNPFQTGYVFQESALFPWFTIDKNLRIPLAFQERQLSKLDLDKRICDCLALVGIEHKRNYYPCQLSGGERQRASIAQTLILDNHLILMDEPFASLDCFTRLTMNKLLISICHKKKISVIFVTHNIDEALQLSDRIVIMKGSPATILKILTIPSHQEERSLFDTQSENLKKEIINIMSS